MRFFNTSSSKSGLPPINEQITFFTCLFFNKTANNQVQYYLVKKMQEQGKIPFKTAALIVFLAGWNIPLIAGLVQRDVSRTFSYSRFSILFLFLMAALTLFSAPFQTLVLKEDRQINDMKRSLYFILLLTLISGIMVTVISSKAIIK